MKFITKIKNILCLASASILLMLPQFVFADTPDGGPMDITNPEAAWGNLFKPFKNDLSIHFLRQIFGNIPGSGLMGGSTSILSQIFYVFNTGVFGLAALFLTYVVVITVYDVAHNPEQMKGKANWMQIIRIPMSVGLMVPLGTTGYSSLNAVIMWSVIQSVGLADNVWQTVVDYIYRGGVLYNTTATNQGIANTIESGLLTGNTVQTHSAGTSDILRSQICMHSLQNILEETRIVIKNKSTAAKALTQGTNSTAPSSTYVTATTSNKVELKPLYINGDTEGTFIARFPYVTLDDIANWGLTSVFTSQDDIDKYLNDACGSYTWVSTPAPDPSCATTGVCDAHGQEYYQKSKGIGMSNLMNDFDTAGKEITDNYYGECFLLPKEVSGNNNTQNTKSGAAEMCTTSRSVFSNYVNNSGPQVLAMSTSTYQSSIYSARLLAGGGKPYVLNKNHVEGGDDDVTLSRQSLKATVKNGGWILAGKYYFDLLESANDTLSSLDDTSKSITFMLDAKGSSLLPPTINADGSANGAYNKIAANDGTDSLYAHLKGFWPTDGADIDENAPDIIKPGNLQHDAVYFPGDLRLNLLLVNNVTENAATLMDKINKNVTKTTNLANQNVNPYIVNITPDLQNYKVTISNDQIASVGYFVFDDLSDALNKVICNWKWSLNTGKDPNFNTATQQDQFFNFDKGGLGELDTRVNTNVQCTPEISYSDAPIVKIAKLGEIMIASALGFWQAFFVKIHDILYAMFGISTALTVAAGVAAPFSFFGVGLGVSSAINTAASLLNLAIKVFVEIPISVGMPLAMAVTGLLFTTGATMAFYVPMIPFMLFTFGVISWLSLVIEAMAAAPIVALGMAHPGGQEFLGNKGEQALMLLLGIFLRPVTMLIGLVAALVLSYVSIDVLNLGFGHLVLSSMAITSTASFTQGTLAAPTAFDQMKNGAMILVYVFMVMALVSQCFSLIHVIPRQMCRWIGIPTEPAVEDKLLGEVQKGMGEFAGAFSKGATEGGAASSRSLGHSGKEITAAKRKPEEKAIYFGDDKEGGSKIK